MGGEKKKKNASFSLLQGNFVLLYNVWPQVTVEARLSSGAVFSSKYHIHEEPPPPRKRMMPIILKFVFM